MFLNCNSLTELDLSTWNTSSLKNVKQMFAWDASNKFESKLKTIYVSSDKFITGSITTDEDMFLRAWVLE